ncbi:K(+)-insensitive pyrophosphate-energized proton pump [Streptomyces narbonensis]
MNLVALLIAPAVVQFGYGEDASDWVRAVVAGLAVLVVVVAVRLSKRRSVAVS